MTPMAGSILKACPEPAVQAAVGLLTKALTAGDGHITPAVETQMQNALYQLRSRSVGADVVGALEAAAAHLRLMAEAKREGRCNLYMSQLLRIRKQMLV